MIVDVYKEKEDYIRQFVRVFTFCAQSKDGSSQEHLADDVFRLAQTSARGLEVQILSVLQRYRTRHVEAILNTQREISGCVDPESRERVLAEHSQQTSRPARLLALLFANSDSEAIIQF
jgi:hypothetical protein